MSKGTWVATLDASALRDDWPTPVNPQSVGILLIKKGAAIHAVRNACAHMGCPLEAGDLDGPHDAARVAKIDCRGAGGRDLSQLTDERGQSLLGEARFNRRADLGIPRQLVHG